MQQITIDNVNTASLSTVFVTTAAGLAPVKITTVYVTDSSYNNTAATAVSTAGGYIKIIGSGFIAGCQVLVNYSPATSTTFISSSELRVQISATAAGTYVLYVVNTDGGTAIRVNGITFSSVPTWATSSTLTDGANNSAISIQLSASSDSTTTFSVASGSTLPTGLALSTSGLLSGTVTGLSVATLYSFTVVATDSELQTNPRTFNITIQVGEQYFAATSLLLSGDGTNAAQNNTFLDSSTNNLSITRSGTPAQGTFSPYGSYWSLYTNGTSSYAYLPYSATRAIGTGDFSIECWVFVAKQPANFTRVWSHQSNYGLAGSVGVELAFGTVDTLIQVLVDGNSQVYNSATYDTTGTNGSGHVRKWIHVVASRQNGYLRIIVDGVLREATANSTNINGTSNTSFGTNSQLGGDLTEMYISNFRMCIGAVPTSYSTTSTTSGTTIFTPPIGVVTTTSQGASGVQLLLFQDNRIIDRSSNAFAVTTVSNPSIQRFNPLGNGKIPYTAGTIGGSAYFNGSTDYLLVGSTPGPITPLISAGAVMTIEAWVNATTLRAGSANDTHPSIVGLGAVYMNFGVANGIPRFMWYTGAITYLDSSIAITANAWNHIAVVFNGSGSSNLKIYVNGILGGTGTFTNLTWSTGAGGNNLYIGAVGNNQATSCWPGYISNLRITNSALYTNNFTPPTSPGTAVASTSLLTNFADAGIYDSAAMNNVITVSSAQVSTSVVKYGTGSLKFNGSSDYLTVLASPNLDMGTGDFTIEAWVYPVSVANNYPSFLASITGWSAGASGHRFNNVGYANKFWFGLNGSGGVASGDPFMASTNTFSFNTWHHYALTRSGNTWRMFVNGNLETTQTYAGAYNPAYGGLRVGWSTWDVANGYFNGYVDDLRITKGYARYTATFTAPTTALLGQ